MDRGVWGPETGLTRILLLHHWSTEQHLTLNVFLPISGGQWAQTSVRHVRVCKTHAGLCWQGELSSHGGWAERKRQCAGLTASASGSRGLWTCRSGEKWPPLGLVIDMRDRRAQMHSCDGKARREAGVARPILMWAHAAMVTVACCGVFNDIRMLSSGDMSHSTWKSWKVLYSPSTGSGQKKKKESNTKQTYPILSGNAYWADTMSEVTGLVL